MDIIYRNVTKGKGAILTGAVLFWSGLLMAFGIGAGGLLISITGIFFYSFGKLKYWWYNE